MGYLKDAAKWYKAEPHQIAAWEELEARLPKHVVEEFKTAYRAAPAAPKPVIREVVTPVKFQEMTGYSASLFSQAECDDCNELFHKTGFSESPVLAAMLMANILHETGNMRWLKKLASGEAYENRADLGNVSPGDGPRFKGAGVLQLTGRYNYSIAAKVLKDERIMGGCDYVAETYPFQSAIPWIEANDLLDVAKTKGFDAVCRRINGGWNGINDRRTKFAVCQRVLHW